MKQTIPIAAAALLLGSLRLDAATEGRFTLGLTGEALSARTEVGGSASKQTSLGGAVLLGVEGALVDRRLLSFEGFLRYSAFDQTETGAARSDLRFDTWSYGGNVRAFSNRTLTLAGNFLHAVSSPTGESTGAVIGGVQDELGAEAAFRTRGLPDLTYAFRDSRFAADDPQTLRDEHRQRQTVKALAAYGLFRAGLEAWKEDVELFSGITRQDLRLGMLNLDVNRGGKNSWETVLTANQVRTASGEVEFSEPTTVLFSRNTFRHRFLQDSHFDLVYSRQSAESPGRQVDADRGEASGFVRLSKSSLLDMTLAYMSVSDGGSASGGRIQQPSGSVGLRWDRATAGWNILVYPRVAYVAIRPDGRDTESGLGGEISLSAQRAWWNGSSVLFDASGLYNDLTIAPVDPNGTLSDPSFLSGLERSRLRARFEWSQVVGRRTRLLLRADASHRVRFFDGRDITESAQNGLGEVTWWSFSMRVGWNRTRQSDAEVPTEVTAVNGTVAWRPTHWLQVDAVASDEQRSVQGSQGSYRYAEGGVTLLYAKLAFFARARESRSSGASGYEWLDRRIWAGIQRTFDFPVLTAGGKATRSGGRNGNGSSTGKGKGQK